MSIEANRNTLIERMESEGFKHEIATAIYHAKDLPAFEAQAVLNVIKEL